MAEGNGGGEEGLSDRRLWLLPTGSSLCSLPRVLSVPMWPSCAQDGGCPSPYLTPPRLGLWGHTGVLRGSLYPLKQTEWRIGVIPVSATLAGCLADIGLLPFWQSWAWPTVQLKWLGRGQGKETRKETKISGSSILCHEGGAGSARASPGGVSPPGGRGQGAGGGGWSLADGFGSGAGGGWQPDGSSEKLLDLLGPFHVVCPWLLARQRLDEVFQASPEAYLL